MNTIEVCKISILVFAVLMLAGGILGFKKAKSKPSLISGIVSALLLGGCYLLSQSNPLLSFKLAFLINGALDGVFLVRLMKTRKFMPAGLMLVLCIIEQIELFTGMKQ